MIKIILFLLASLSLYIGFHGAIDPFHILVGGFALGVFYTGLILC